jgi:hypothetical protein
MLTSHGLVSHFGFYKDLPELLLIISQPVGRSSKAKVELSIDSIYKGGGRSSEQQKARFL